MGVELGLSRKGKNMNWRYLKTKVLRRIFGL